MWTKLSLRERLLLPMAVMIVGALMVIYVFFGGMTATTWVQIIKAALLLGGASFMALSVLWHFGFSPEAMFAGAVAIKTDLALKDGKTADAGPETARVMSNDTR